MPRIIKLRAPWADAESIIKEIEACPKRYGAKTLGKLVNLSGYEWREYGIRTMTPVDMTEEEMRDYKRIRAEGRRLNRRRTEGMTSRAKYLESHSLNQPWITEGVSRATWFRNRKRTERETGLAQVKLLIDSDQTSLSREEDMAAVPSAPLRSPTSLLAQPDPYHFIPVCVPGQPNLIPYGRPVEFSRAA